jgi:hypothetical protein
VHRDWYQMPLVIRRNRGRRAVIVVVVATGQLQSDQSVVQEEVVTLNGIALALIQQHDYALVVARATDLHPGVHGIIARAHVQP